MEPITTVVLVNFLSHLAKVGLEKVVENIADNSTNKTRKWLKSLFYDENKPKQVLQNLKNNPENEDFKKNAVQILKDSIKENPEFEKYLKELIDKNIDAKNINNIKGDLKGSAIGDHNTINNHF